MIPIRTWLPILVLIAGSGCVLAQGPAKPGDDLQAILDSGEDLVLQQGALYNIEKTLRYKKAGQKIYTKDAKYPSQYATLKLSNADLMQLVNGGNVKDVVFTRVICDGNRYQLSTVPKPRVGGGGQPALLFFGSTGGDGARIVENVFLNTRTWSTVKMHELAKGLIAENNLVIGAGVDPRGNGREANEIPFNWGDGFSCASPDSIIRNNFILDPTDVGIVFYGAPNSIAEDNVIVTVSRESLGGINLVDPLELYWLDEEGRYTDYRGVKIRHNLVDAYGGRIHMGFPMGTAPWVPRNKGKDLKGAEITGNTMAGGAAAYGFVVHGVGDWKVRDNISTATYSGIADGLGPDNRPHPPTAFVYDPETIQNTELQDEFVKAHPHIEHLLRCNHGPEDSLGYRVYNYGDAEVTAVIEAAYLEMLGRPADESGIQTYTKLLQKNEINADGLRRILMASEEFTNQFGYVHPQELHPYRNQLWFNILNEIIRKEGKFPSANVLYKKALEALRIENRETTKTVLAQ